MYIFNFFASSSDLITGINTEITAGFTELSDIIIGTLPILIAMGFAFWAIRIIRKKVKV
ncbi:hypothetical protein KAI52_00605 [Candidatus Parcubacteria bacterium]|nr:hypothetical protein [Candidatus Parcubacteria bacterium]